MIKHPPEHFGTHEKPISDEEKERITKYLKYDRHVPLKLAEMVFSGEAEAEYFSKFGRIASAVVFTSALFLPIVRGLPVKQRLFWAALPGYYVYNWGENYREQLSWNKTYAAWQKCILAQGRHPKLQM